MSRLFDYVIESLNEPKEVDMVFEENQLVMATAQDLVTVTEATYEYLMAEKEYHYGEITMEGLGDGIAKAMGTAVDGLKGLWEKIKKFFANIRDIILGKKKDKSSGNSSSSSSSSSTSSSSNGTSSTNKASYEEAKKSAEEKKKANDAEFERKLKEARDELERVKKKKEQLDAKDKEANEKLDKGIELKQSAIDRLVEKRKKEEEEAKKRDPLGVYSSNNKKEEPRKEYQITNPAVVVDLEAIHLKSGINLIKKFVDLKEANGSELTAIELREHWTNDKIIATLFKGSLPEKVNEENYITLCKEKYSKKVSKELNKKDCDFYLRELREKAISQLNTLENELQSLFDTMIKEYDKAMQDVESKREPIYDRPADNNIQILNIKRGIMTKASSYMLRYISTWRSCVMASINELEDIKKKLG